MLRRLHRACAALLAASCIPALVVAQPAPPQNAATVREKALAINTGGTMGTLEEIGALPRTLIELFEAGRASGSLLAARVTYGKGASKELYGEVKRFVSRERVEQMVDRLFADSVRFAHHPGEEVPPATRLFAFGNSVSTNPTGPGGGWLGVKFRRKPEGQVPASALTTGASTLLVEFRVNGIGVPEQAAQIGKLGINAIHGAFYRSATTSELLPALVQELNTDAQRRVEIRSLIASGPDLIGFEPHRMGVEMLRARCTEHVMMARAADGARPVDPGDVVYGKVPLAHRADAIGPWHDAPDLAATLGLLVTGEPAALALVELPLVIAADPAQEDARLVSAQAAAIGEAGACILTSHPDPAAIGAFLSEGTRGPVLVAVDRAELRSLTSALDPAWHRGGQGHPPQVRYVVSLPEAELKTVLSGNPVADLVDEGAVILLLEPSQAAILPGKRLAAALRALPLPSGTRPSAPLYRVPLAADTAKALLTPAQAVALEAQVNGGVIAVGAP